MPSNKTISPGDLDGVLTDVFIEVLEDLDLPPATVETISFRERSVFRATFELHDQAVEEIIEYAFPDDHFLLPGAHDGRPGTDNFRWARQPASLVCLRLQTDTIDEDGRHTAEGHLEIYWLDGVRDSDAEPLDMDIYGFFGDLMGERVRNEASRQVSELCDMLIDYQPVLGEKGLNQAISRGLSTASHESGEFYFCGELKSDSVPGLHFPD